MIEQSFKLLYRSATRTNLSSMVRPDNIDILIQQDYAFTEDWYMNYTTNAPCPFDWKRPIDGEMIISPEVEDGDLNRCFDKVTSNINLDFDKSSENEVWLANNNAGILEAYREPNNHELRNGPMAMEDGRSRRYIVRSGPGRGAMISHDIIRSGELIRYGYYSDSKGFVTNRTSLLRWCKRSERLVPIGISILHGRNMSWLEYKQKTGATLQEMSNSIDVFFRIADKVLLEMQNWAKENDGLYIVILAKDHRLRYPHMNYLDLYDKHKNKWHLPSPVASLNDCWNDPQWWETHGYACSREIEGDVCIHHIDDHCPAIFSFSWFGQSLPLSVERRMASKYMHQDKSIPYQSLKGYPEEPDTNLLSIESGI